jgi:transaldolase
MTGRTGAPTNPLVRLGELGQSPWYDYITRDLVTTGELARLIAEDGLRGMTSNPTIFEKAIAGSRLYDDDIRAQADAGRSPREIFEHLAVADVRAACDTFAPLYRAAGGADGLVSLEVSPTLANDTDATIHEAERLWRAVDRPNAMIKIPGTPEGLPAITHCIAAGINVNVTLLFSVDRYGEVIEAFLSGLERRLEAGRPLAGTASVASFFVSRVDGRVDPLLDRLGDPERLRGRIAIANACAAYRLF